MPRGRQSQKSPANAGLSILLPKMRAIIPDEGFDVELINHDNHTVVNFDGLTLIGTKRHRMAKSVTSKGLEKPL